MTPTFMAASEIRKRIALRLKEQRTQKDLTHGQLSALTQGRCTTNTISNIERCQVEPKISTLYYLAVCLDTDVMYFIGE